MECTIASRSERSDGGSWCGTGVVCTATPALLAASTYFNFPFFLSSFPNFSPKMTVKEQIVHDRVNLVRLMRRLDKSANEGDWGTERSWTLWLKSERVLQVGPIFNDKSYLKLNV